MQNRAKKFIDILESQALLAPEIVEELRRQVAESKTRLTPELLAKLLVDNGHLTKFQATKLITSAKEDSADDKNSTSPTAGGSEDDELGLAEEDLGFSEEADTNSNGGNVAAVFIDDDDDDSRQDDVIEVDVVEAVEPVEVVEVVEVVPHVAVEAVDVETAGDFSADNDAFGTVPKAIAKPVRQAGAKANPWDSFRILGVGIILALVLIAGFFLVNWMLKGNADDVLTRANDAYEQRSYETASTMYSEFAASWPSHEKTSFAKVRSALAALRKDTEGAPDPTIGLKTAMDLLPGIAEEPGLSEQQSDLAGALISLAGKFNERADQRDSSEERKLLMGQMDDLLKLIDDPKFVGQTQKKQQEPTLLKISEDRSRILREINRDEELDRALAAMDEKLQAKDVPAAYQLRMNLINEYPLLEANEGLQARVAAASKIQQSLVVQGSISPSVSNEAPQSVIGNSFVLGNKFGTTAPSLQGDVVFSKVKGAVYGLDGATGDILWRKYVGREFNADPIRLGESKSPDALICVPEKGHVSRVDGRTGETKWFVDFGVPTHMPVVETEDLFVATFDGEVASLDLNGGQIMWTKKLPQPLLVGPGVAFGKPNLYIAAEHSNVYVLSRRDGSCREVMYLGHRQGAVVVPPILMLGQLFLSENINASSSKVRVIATDENGLGLREAQLPFQVDGNIVVAPQQSRRRLVVQSDLGELQVLDIEPTVDTDKVSVLASRAKTAFSPQLSWVIAGDNQLWVAESRFERFDLQVSMGKLSGNWSKHDGDRFTTAPQKFGDVIVHSRIVRGNQGVRVSAVKAEDGSALWSTDLGVPVTMITRSSGSGFDAINTGGMLFQLDRNQLRSAADANPGQGKAAMNFGSAATLPDGTTLLLNQSKANQFALYSAEGGQLRILSANFGGAAPSCDPVAVQDKVAIGLDNGQFILIDPTNGSLAASPYQPPMKPGVKVQWNTPVYLEDSQTLVVASDLQKLVRLGVGNSLRSLTEVDLETPLSGPLAYVGNKIIATKATGAGDELVFFDAASLEPGKSIPLPGNVVAGPFAADQACIVQTDSSLVAVSTEESVLWTVPFPKSELVAAPTREGDNWIFVTRSGETWVLGANDGAVVGNNRAGQGFSSAPIVLPGGRMLVGSDEGAVLALPVPDAPSAPDSSRLGEQ